MPPKKTPTSSLSVPELLINRVWYRTLAGIQKMYSGGTSPETSTTCSSPATRLPQEIVEMIISYLTYDILSLRACTLTCYSWYIAAVPHLHHTLTITNGSRDSKFCWPDPIQYMYTLGLLPLVKEFRILDCGRNYNSVGLSPKLFNYCILHQFLALTNVRKLELGHLDIPKFMPRIRRYFGHLTHTTRSLVLIEPRGSRRQIIYFIGLFQHLQDLELTNDRTKSGEEPADDLTFIPPFVPPLRGWLKIRHFTRVGLLKDMIDLFGGIRFRYMHLLDVVGMRLLLDACAETLRTLVLYPADPRAGSSLRDFDLSKNKALRILEFPASSIDCALNGTPETASSFLKHVFSTITSSAFFGVIILYWDQDFRGAKPRDPGRSNLYEMSPAEKEVETSKHNRRFELLREVHKVRGFRLVLGALTSGRMGEYPVQILEEAVAEGKEKKVFDDIFSEPFVMYSPWI